MATHLRELPLFPLNTVLFPGASIPLHIFEERYRLMMKRCLEADATFGAVLIKRGMEVGELAIPYGVGTLAKIVQVSELEQGRMYIAAWGVGRFRIQEVTQRHPYLVGQVCSFPEPDADAEPGLVLEVRQALAEHLRTVAGLRGGWVQEPPTPHFPLTLSYAIGASIRGNLAGKQRLLETSSVQERLVRGLALLKRETKLARQELEARGPWHSHGRN